MIAWMLYSAVVTMVIAAAARAAETLGRLAGNRLRWVWVGALALSAGLAASSALRHTTPRAPVVVSNPAPLMTSAPATPTWAQSIERVVDRASRVLNAPLQAAATAVQSGLSPDATVYVFAGWSAMTLAMAVLGTLIARRFNRARSTWPTGRVGGVSVRVSPNIGPVVLGLVRPEIVVPQWLFGRAAEEQRLAVVHEHEHVRARDPLVLAFGWLVVLLAPWNVACWYMVSRLRLTIELDCDTRVLRRGAAPQTYGSLLIDVAQHAAPLSLSALGLADESSQLYQRILALRRREAPYPRLRAAAASACLAACLLVACRVAPPSLGSVSTPAPNVVRSTASVAPSTTIAMSSTAPAKSARRSRRSAAVSKAPIVSDTVPAVAIAAIADTTLPVAIDSSSPMARIWPKHAPSEEPIVFIDGKRSTLDAFHSMVDTGTIRQLPAGGTLATATHIERVEVLKGPAAIAEYGADAVNGVITITTKKSTTP